MILPIVTYGDPVLRTRAHDIPQDLPDLDKLIDDMFQTMYNAKGVGLAAPQIGKSIRVFVVDASAWEDEDLKDFKGVYINPTLRLDEMSPTVKFEEGCLSIPGLREKVERPDQITICYHDAQFNPHEDTFSGIRARILQHEYDHLEGVLFTDKVSTLRKSVLVGKLKSMAAGEVSASYPLKATPKRKK